MTALTDLPPLDAADDDGPALGLLSGPGTCTRKPWCLSPAGHRGGCRKYAEDDPRRKKGKASGGSSSSSSRRSGAPRSSSAAPARRSRSSIMPAVWAFAYGSIGQAIEAQGPEPAAPAMGRVMQFQSIDAGERLHRVLSKVPAYRQATALAGGGLVEDLAELVAAPMLAAVMASNEAARDMLWPILAASLQKSAVSMVKVQREQHAAMSELNDYADEAGAILEDMAASLFAPRRGHAEPAEGGDGGG